MPADNVTPIRRPTKLGPAGRALWSKVATGYELRIDEAVILEQACRTADLIEDLQTVLMQPGVQLEVRGSKNQKRAHPLLAEVRAQRVTLDKLLSSLRLREAEDLAGQGALWSSDAASARSAQARRAAESRWRRG